MILLKSIKVVLDIGVNPRLMLKRDAQHFIPAVPPRAIVKRNSSSNETYELLCTTGRSTEMHHDIVEFPKWAHLSESLLLPGLFFTTSFLSAYLIPFIQLKLPKCDNILEEEVLDGEIDRMPLAADPLLNGIPLDILILSEMDVDRATEGIVRGGVVCNDSSKSSNDSILLQYWEKSIPLFFSGVARYFAKSKKGFHPVFPAIHEVGTDCKKKVVVWRCPNIDGQMDIRQRCLDPSSDDIPLCLE